MVCRDFITQGKQFVPFNDVGESTLEHDKDQYQYDYIDIMKMLKDNLKITDVEETISMFWDIYIVDALIGNFDRHGSNWGFIKENNNSEEETNKRVYTFPTSQIRLNNKKSSYYEVIYSLEYKECNEALDRMYGRINIDDIERIIEDPPLLTQEQKGFYYYIIKSRYEKILKASWKKL